MNRASQSDSAKKTFENSVIFVATALQGISAAIIIFDYITLRISDVLGVIKIYQLVMLFSGLAVLCMSLLLEYRRGNLSQFQSQLAKGVIIVGSGLILVLTGFWVAENKRSSQALIELVPIPVSDIPFLQLRSFEFEGSEEGWAIDEEVAPTTVSIETDQNQSHGGTGYMRLRTELPGIKGSSIELTETILLYFSDTNWTNLTEVVIGYVQIVPSDQTISNVFHAEIRVSANYEDKEIWSKTQYELTPGQWIPIIWVKPTWLTNEENEIFFPDKPTVIGIMLWSEKPFTGQVLIDDISLYRISR